MATAGPGLWYEMDAHSFWLDLPGEFLGGELTGFFWGEAASGITPSTGKQTLFLSQ